MNSMVTQVEQMKLNLQFYQGTMHLTSLTIVTANKEIFKIDMAKNSGTKELLKTAE
jgi:hypothetical protein